MSKKAVTFFYQSRRMEVGIQSVSGVKFRTIKGIIMQYRRKIFGYECDIYGHLNNANYLHLYEEARSEALEQMEMPINKLQEMGYNIYVTHLELNFVKGAELGETITIESDVSETNRVRSVWKQEIYNSKQELCNKAIVTGVFIKNGKPARISKELFEYFLRFKGQGTR